jgi:ATP-dependent DNA helicase RecG
MSLPVNIEQLLSGNVVEWERLEFKEGWNPEAVMHSICAFANDINNWGGGYIILGVTAKNGQAILPPKGLQQNQIDPIQKKLLEVCNLINPPYYPIVEPVEYLGKKILILWVPGGDNRPYKAPITLGKKSSIIPWVRRYSNTKKANHTEERQLYDLAARIPFDDRVNQQAQLGDMKLSLIQSFLQEVKSNLISQTDNNSFTDICRQMNIVRGPKEEFKPLNVGLLFFSDKPVQYFQGAKIEVVEYKDNIGDDYSEKIFTSPIHQQLKDALEYLKSSVLKEEIRKLPGKAKSQRFFNYPYEAIEESLANAVYHRSYEDSNSIEVNVWFDKIEILSYPGPIPPVDNSHLKKPRILARYYRNRRVGDFLKELRLTEGRGTGIPKIRNAMKLNGSPSPTFKTDRNRTYFLTTLPIHPKASTRRLIVQKIQDNRTKTLIFCVQPKSRKEILAHLGLKNYPENYKKHILPLLNAKYIALTIPNKPRSSKQQYVTTKKGKNIVEKKR